MVGGDTAGSSVAGDSNVGGHVPRASTSAVARALTIRSIQAVCSGVKGDSPASSDITSGSEEEEIQKKKRETETSNVARCTATQPRGHTSAAHAYDLRPALLRLTGRHTQAPPRSLTWVNLSG